MIYYCVLQNLLKFNQTKIIPKEYEIKKYVSSADINTLVQQRRYTLEGFYRH